MQTLAIDANDESDDWTLRVGDHVVAGLGDPRSGPDDVEDGTILEIDGDRALIAWRQGTRTWAQIADLQFA